MPVAVETVWQSRRFRCREGERGGHEQPSVFPIDHVFPQARRFAADSHILEKSGGRRDEPFSPRGHGQKA
jgi:hypothetical protein